MTCVKFKLKLTLAIISMVFSLCDKLMMSIIQECSCVVTRLDRLNSTRLDCHLLIDLHTINPQIYAIINLIAILLQFILNGNHLQYLKINLQQEIHQHITQ